MRRTTSERLLVLKRRQHHEYDAVVTVLSPRRGRLNLLAKGLARPRSKLAGHLEPLTVIDALVVWGSRPLLSGAVSRQSFGHLKSQLVSVVLASQIVNRYQRWLPTGQDNQAAWNDLVSLLTAWDEQLMSLAALTWQSQAIQWRLASQLGHAADLEHCVNCLRPLGLAAWWSASEGGLFCPACRPVSATLKLSTEARQHWRLMLGNDWLELTKTSPSPTILEQITDFFNGWVNFLDHYVC